VKIGIVSHYFWPELSAPSARLLELGRCWVEAGHDVTVVTNFPNHPTGVVPEAYRGRRFLIEEVDGLRVVRCRTYATPNRGFARRTLGHLAFMFWSVLQGARPLTGVDVIVASSPTLFSVVGAWLLSLRLSAPFVFEVRDLWPSIFVELGVLRSRPLIRALEGLELFLYRRSAAVVTVTRSFADDIQRRGIPREKLHFVPNGVDLDAFQPAPADETVRRELCGDAGFLVLYCGAHGISHALGRVLELAARHRDDPELRFAFVGEGAEKPALVAEAERLSLANVRFLSGVPRDRVADLYRAADLVLVPLRDIPVFRTFIPSKMFEVMACGRPILASLAGEAAAILERSGAARVVPPEDVDALDDALARLRGDPGLRHRLGERGRPFAAAEFDRRALGKRYLEVLDGVAGAPLHSGDGV